MIFDCRNENNVNKLAENDCAPCKIETAYLPILYVIHLIGSINNFSAICLRIERVTTPRFKNIILKHFEKKVMCSVAR